MRRHFVLLALAAWAWPAGGAWGDVARAVRAGDWAGAAADAAAYPDPLAGKLVTFYRLQHQGAAGAAEIAAFLGGNPDWPNQAILLKRRDESLATEPDDAVAARLCLATPIVPGPRSSAALARCAAASAALGQRDDAVAAARSAWVAGFADAQSEAAFLARWKTVLTAADQQARFEAVLAAGGDAASQAGRLAPDDERLARARLAVRAGDASAPGLVAALPPAQRHAPELVLDGLRALQKAGRDDEAARIWTGAGFAAERAAGAARAAAFWSLRAQLARRRLRAGDDRMAFTLADDTMQASPETRADAAFLAGFIALRRLHQFGTAAARFRLLIGSTAAISQARGHYWLARVAAAVGDEAGARADYAAAASWPTTYYGQLATLALGGDEAGLDARILALADPAWSSGQALDFAGRELSRAATLLVAWGDPIRARPFLSQVSALAADPVTRSMTAHLALGLGLPDQAVAAARVAGREGVLLPQAGWPLAVAVPQGRVPVAAALGIMRQESSFDPQAISPSGARGLMQLMPATARQIGGGSGGADALIGDPAGNVRLGTAYLGALLDQFGASLPLAIAAYNAGPSRVAGWLGEMGDPRGAGREAMIDWVEEIPFAETRNYVQRVIENIVIYRARRNEVAPYPVGA